MNQLSHHCRRNWVPSSRLGVFQTTLFQRRRLTTIAASTTSASATNSDSAAAKETSDPRPSENSKSASSEPPNDATPRPSRWRRFFTSIIFTIKFLALAHLFTSKVMIIGVCEGPSMLPTFSSTMSSVILNHLYSRGRGIKVGDLVTAYRPDDMSVMMLKRVIGMPGDYIVIDPMSAGRGEETMMVRVPEGHCWIGGDNLPYSIDSRFYGPIPLALVKSRVEGRITGGFTFFKNPFTLVPPWD